MATIDEKVERLEKRMETVEATLNRIAVINEDTDRRLNDLTQRIDNFVRESSRVFGNHGDRLGRIEATVESMANTVQYLLRKDNENKVDIAALAQVVQATAQNIDRLELQQEATNQRVDQLIQAVDQQGIRLDTLINRIVDNPDEN